MTWIGIATPRLYCPATLLEILSKSPPPQFSLEPAPRAHDPKKALTHHATMEGYAAYPPDTIKNVPKYFAPIPAPDKLIANPTRQRSCPAWTNGDRIFLRSDHIPKVITSAAVQ